MFKITKKSIILTLLAIVVFPSLFIIYMFAPRAEITYNCDSYKNNLKKYKFKKEEVIQTFYNPNLALISELQSG